MQSDCIRNTNHLILCIEINVVKCGTKIKHIEFVEKITEFLKLQQIVHIVTTGI